RPPWLVLTSALGTVIFLVYAWVPTADPLGAALLAFFAGIGAYGWVGIYFIISAEAGGATQSGLLSGVSFAAIVIGLLAGAPTYFVGGGVIYTQAARRGLLRVGDDAVKGIRSSSEPYAQLKAKAVRELMGATWGLAETGASGPTGNRYGDAAGHACIAVAGPVERVITVETGDADRERNMWAFTRAA